MFSGGYQKGPVAWNRLIMNLSTENETLLTKYEVMWLEGKDLVTLLIVKINDNKIRLPDELLNDISLDYITLIPYEYYR